LVTEVDVGCGYLLLADDPPAGGDNGTDGLASTARLGDQGRLSQGRKDQDLPEFLCLSFSVLYFSVHVLGSYCREHRLVCYVFGDCSNARSICLLHE
jgi:hypothetical protein